MYPGRRRGGNKAQIEAQRKRKSNARIYDSFPIRTWDHWLDERQVRIFVQALDGDGLAKGAPRDLLLGTKLLASPGFAGRQPIPAKSKSSSRPTTTRSCSPPPPIATRPPIFTDAELFVDLAGGEPRAITQGTASWSRPCFTRDGRTLLALVEEQGPAVYNAQRLAAFSWPDLGKPRISPVASTAP